MRRAVQVGVVAVAIFAAAFSFPPERCVTLRWDYQTDPKTVFIVESSVDLLNWQHLATLPPNARGLVVTADKPAEFFRVSASNSLTGLSSVFARN